MRSPAKRSRWVFPVSRSSAASSKSASATSIKTRAFRSGRCGDNASFHVVAMDAVFHRRRRADPPDAGGDLRPGREGRAAAASLPRLSRLPHRCRVPAHGWRKTYRQGRGRVSDALCPATRRTARVRDSRSSRMDAISLPARLADMAKCWRAGWLIAVRAISCSRAAAARRLQRPRKFVAELQDARCRSARGAGGHRFAQRRAATCSRRSNPSGQPLRGLFHLAMVIDDAPLAALTPERMRDRYRTQGARRMAAARSDAGNESRLLRDVLVCLEHFRQSGAGKLQRGERFSRYASRIIVRRSVCPRLR